MYNVYIYTHIHIYIHIYRERERENVVGVFGVGGFGQCYVNSIYYGGPYAGLSLSIFVISLTSLSRYLGSVCPSSLIL